jgi:hypothetical protein
VRRGWVVLGAVSAARYALARVALGRAAQVSGWLCLARGVARGR